MHELTNKYISFITKVGAAYLFEAMVLIFLGAVLMRLLIYYTIQREVWFAIELDKRTQRFLASEDSKGDISFYLAAKRLLEKTFYELFEIRAVMKRRKPDPIMALSDRIFLINQGAAWLVRDTLRQVKYLKHGKHDPDFMQISKNVFQNNPCFNKVFGIIPAATFNEVVNVLPGMLIVGGIFGTFLGVMAALPNLGNINVQNVEGTKAAMNDFLQQLGFAMTTSISGILFSVSLGIVNSLFSPERLFVQAVERFENTLAVLWNRSDDNKLPEDTPEFDEHKDPFEALAEQAVNRQLSSKRNEEEEQRKAPSLVKPNKAS